MSWACKLSAVVPLPRQKSLTYVELIPNNACSIAISSSRLTPPIVIALISPHFSTSFLPRTAAHRPTAVGSEVVDLHRCHLLPLLS